MFNAATVTGGSRSAAPGRSLWRTASRLADTGTRLARRSAVEFSDGRDARVDELESLDLAGLQTEEGMRMLNVLNILSPVGPATFMRRPAKVWLGVFFPEQTVDSVINGVLEYEKKEDHSYSPIYSKSCTAL